MLNAVNVGEGTLIKMHLVFAFGVMVLPGIVLRVNDTWLRVLATECRVLGQIAPRFRELKQRDTNVFDVKKVNF